MTTSRWTRWFNPDRQFLALVLLLSLLLVGWRLDGRAPAAPQPKAEEAEPGPPVWAGWLPSAHAAELPAVGTALSLPTPTFTSAPVPAPAEPVPARAGPEAAAARTPPRRDETPTVERPIVADERPAPAFAVQLGSYASWQNALHQARALRSRSLRPELVLEDGARPVIRLVVGRFASRGAALHAAAVYRRQRHQDAWIYERADSAVPARWAR